MPEALIHMAEQLGFIAMEIHRNFARERIAACVKVA
jgi:hypothetical protein